jgi:dipeptidyl aminopeptidase/acylaminoacyl peptidase
MYHFAPDKFLPDGSFSTAYAAQPLASAGFAVLQMRFEDVEGMTTPREGPSFVEGLDSAVEHLASLNLVDSKRVALVGFSRGGYLTSYAVANPGRVRLAAAVDADGGDPSYVQYLIDSVVSPAGRIGAAEYEQLYGGGSFWENRSAWLSNAPGFNTDRVQTPLLLTVNGVQNRTSFLELYVGLRANGRPVELLHFPQGEHELKKPRERQASLQATVDWMSFWLLGAEPAATPASSERFSRWRAMRFAWHACCAKTSESASRR